LKAFSVNVVGSWSPQWTSGPSLFSLAIAGNEVLGGVPATDVAYVTSVNATDGGADWSFPDGGLFSAAGVPVVMLSVGPNNKVLVGLNGGSPLILVDLGAGAPTASSTVLPSLAAPAVFAADGTLFVADTSGAVTAFDGSLQSLWTINVSGPVFAAPTLDCARDSGGNKLARPGTLYVGTMAGYLHAIVTDSHGIDTTAVWPKFQHDPRNTGNAGTAMSEFACP
jgi:hypothetical protein